MSTTTVMVLARFCRVVAQSPELSPLDAAGDIASARGRGRWWRDCPNPVIRERQLLAEFGRRNKLIAAH
jgi:hypothetical protein